MRNLAFVGLSALVAWTIGTGCSGSGDGGAEKQFALSGMYRATSAGAISTITFYDPAHYFLWRSCTDGSCLEHGSFALDDAHTTLSLASVETGQTTSLPFSVLQAAPPGLTTQNTHVLGGISLYGDGGSLTSGDGGALTNGDGGTLASGDGGLYQINISLVISFTMGGQNFGGSDGGDDDSGGGGNNGNGGGSDAGTGGDASSDAGQVVPSKGQCGSAMTAWGSALDNNAPGKGPCTVISSNSQTELNSCFNNGTATQSGKPVASLACRQNGQFAYACVAAASNFCHDTTYGP